MSNDAKAVAKGAGANLVGMLARLLRPVFLFAAASMYGSASFGQYMLAWAIVDVLGKAATFGFDKAVMRFVPITGGPERERALAAALRGTVLGSVALSLGLAAAAAALAAFYHMPDLRWVLILLSPAVATTAVVTLSATALMAVEKMRGQILVRGILDPLLLIVFSIGFRFTLGRAPWVLALAHGVAQAACVAAALWVYGRTFRLGITGGRQPELVRFALPMWASDGLAVAQSRADLLVMARLLPDPAVIGMYAVAKQIANVVSVVRFAFDPVFWPRVAALSRRGDQVALQETYRLVARWVAMLAFPAALVLARFGPDLGRLVGRDYRGPLAVFAFLTVGQTFNAVFGLAGHLMAMAGRPRVVVWGYVLGSAITVVATIALVPPLGIAGAAVASALAYVTVMSYQVLQAFRTHHVSPLSWGLGKAFAAAAVMALALALLGNVTQPALAIAGAFAAYAVCLWALGPEPEDRALLRRKTA